MIKKILKLCFATLFIFGLLGQANAGGKLLLPPEVSVKDCGEYANPYCQAILSGDLEAVKKLINDNIIK